MESRWLQPYCLHRGMRANSCAQQSTFTVAEEARENTTMAGSSRAIRKSGRNTHRSWDACLQKTGSRRGALCEETAEEAGVGGDMKA